MVCKTEKISNLNKIFDIHAHHNEKEIGAIIHKWVRGGHLTVIPRRRWRILQEVFYLCIGNS